MNLSVYYTERRREALARIQFIALMDRGVTEVKSSTHFHPVFYGKAHKMEDWELRFWFDQCDKYCLLSAGTC